VIASPARKNGSVTVFPDYGVSAAPSASFEYRQLFEFFARNPQAATPTPDKLIADGPNAANDATSRAVGVTGA
jgi:hypothetical protein